MIITTSPKGHNNGNWRHVFELQTTTELTQHVDTEDLLKMGFSDIKWIIFAGGWNDDYETINNFAKEQGVKTALLHCSPIGQTHVCDETRFMNEALGLLQSCKLDHLFVGSREHAIALNESGISKVSYLPQTMEYKRYLTMKTNPCKDYVGLFNSVGHNKNTLTQIVVARMLNKTLITNSLKDDAVISFANRIGLRYHSYGWVDDEEEYLRLLCMCSVGLQCSWSEAFDYVAAEMSLLGIPVVTGPTIDWNLPSLIVSDIDNPVKVKACLEIADLTKPEQIRKKIIDELDIRAEEAKRVLGRDLLGIN